MTDHLAPDWNGEGGFFNIRDLTGIEACTDLRWLRVGCDDITSFEPLLGIATLKSVDFAGGQLRDLSLFEKLPALRTVSLEGVLLTSTEENVAAFRALCDRGVWVHFDCEVDGALRDAIIARDKARWQAYAAAVEPRIERARRALEEGRLDDAEANIEEVLEMDRDEVRAVTLSGLVAMKRGDMPLALAHLSRAALMEPESLEANEAFFEACMKVGNHQNALFAISNQIAVHDTPGRRRARAEVHAHMGNYDEAVEDTTAVIRSIDENEPGGDAQGLARDYNKRGEYNFYRNNKEAALADWTKAAELGSVEAKRRLHSGPGEKKR
jgi:tetratricopeptide (TPR) repeat protein